MPELNGYDVAPEPTSFWSKIWTGIKWVGAIALSLLSVGAVFAYNDTAREWLDKLTAPKRSKLDDLAGKPKEDGLGTKIQKAYKKGTDSVKKVFISEEQIKKNEAAEALAIASKDKVERIESREYNEKARLVAMGIGATPTAATATVITAKHILNTQKVADATSKTKAAAGALSKTVTAPFTQLRDSLTGTTAPERAVNNTINAHKKLNAAHRELRAAKDEVARAEDLAQSASNAKETKQAKEAAEAAKKTAEKATEKLNAARKATAKAIEKSAAVSGEVAANGAKVAEQAPLLTKLTPVAEAGLKCLGVAGGALEVTMGNMHANELRDKGDKGAASAQRWASNIDGGVTAFATANMVVPIWGQTIGPLAAGAAALTGQVAHEAIALVADPDGSRGVTRGLAGSAGNWMADKLFDKSSESINKEITEKRDKEAKAKFDSLKPEQKAAVMAWDAEAKAQGRHADPLSIIAVAEHQGWQAPAATPPQAAPEQQKQ